MSVAALNAQTWSRRRYVRHYRGTELRPAEALMLAEHARRFAGRVLELGCGAGRVTGHLAERASELVAIDISAGMLREARRRHPGVTFLQLDMTAIGGFDPRSFDAVIATCNVIDVLDDGDRRGLFAAVRNVLADDGIYVFSSHNRAHIPLLREPWQVPTHRALALGNAIVRLPARMRNRARLKPHEVHAPGYDILNDSAHDWTLLQYYVDPAGARGQLAAADLELAGCVALDGTPVDEDDPDPQPVELYYVAAPSVDRDGATQVPGLERDGAGRYRSPALAPRLDDELRS